MDAMIASADPAQLLFFFSAILLILWRMWRGWRLGVVRQVINLVALGLAYAAAIFGGRLAAPVLRPLGFPDLVLAILCGALLGVIVYGAISVTGAVIFKRTAHQSVGLVRLGYGAAGAAIGAVFGLVTVWAIVLGIRVLGTVAESEIAIAKTDVHSTPPGRAARSLAGMKHSLEEGPTGRVIDRTDPIPVEFYELLQKLSLTVSNPERVKRFLDYPGARELAEHPRIQALQDDPEIAREIHARNYLALLRNDQIVRAANDPDLIRIIRNFELQKALDHALRN
jgi:hypothetical protein